MKIYMIFLLLLSTGCATSLNSDGYMGVWKDGRNSEDSLRRDMRKMAEKDPGFWERKSPETDPVEELYYNLNLHKNR